MCIINYYYSMDIDKIKKEIDQYFESNGGYLAVLSRMSVQKVYASLYFRCKMGEESIEFAKASQFQKYNYLLELYTKTGISKLKIPANSCFDFKWSILSDTVYRVNEFAEKYHKKYPDARIYLLYQERGVLTDSIIQEVKRKKLVVLFQIEEFLKHIDKTAKINDHIERMELDWKAKREVAIDKAKFAFREDRCCFFLGAGVSMDAGGPSWEDLLRKIVRHFKGLGLKGDFEKVYSWCGMSPIILGRYVASGKKRLMAVSDYLRRYVLYNKVDIDKSELIKSICEAVKGPQENERNVLTGKIDSIITYNYDDLIETALEKFGVSTARIYLKNRNRRNEFPVFHVHGLIPQMKREIASTPVFSEKEYHEMYKEAYHWSNVEQLHALDRNTCFFIGMSMNDPNLRRLLDISRSGGDNECHHFVFLKRENLFEPEEVDKNEMHFTTVENQLEGLGVQVIWYEEHSEVPGLLRKVITPLMFVG